MFLPSLISARAYMMRFLDDHVAGGLGDDLERVEDGNAGLRAACRACG